jgi:hypothetical protein
MIDRWFNAPRGYCDRQHRYADADENINEIMPPTSGVASKAA